MGAECSCFSFHDKRNIHEAAALGDLDRVMHLVQEHGVPVDCRDWSGQTPLHMAAQSGSLEVADFLIRNECYLNLKNRKGSTPLAMAASYRRRDVAHFLVQRGAEVNCVLRETVSVFFDESPLLHHACRQGWSDVVLSIVERDDEDLNAAYGTFGMTPLMIAISSSDPEEIKQYIAEILVRAGADVNQGDSEMWTALHLASFEGNNEMVKWLLKVNSLNINLQEENGCTALHIACNAGHSEVVKELLKAGADTTIRCDCFICITRALLNIEYRKLYVEYGFFFEYNVGEWSYLKLFLEQNVLTDVDFCTQAIVNKYNRKSLPALYRNPNVARWLPAKEKLKLKSQETRQVANFVKSEIKTKSYCNVMDVRPMVLKILCVESFINRQE